MVYGLALTNGGAVLLDQEDWEWAERHRWYQKNGYACRHERVGRRQYREIYLHREVMGVTEPGHRFHVHHRDGDRLNNQRANLFVGSVRQHREEHHLDTLADRFLAALNDPQAGRHRSRAHDSPPYPGSASGLKGVSWHCHNRRWCVSITVDGEKLDLGYYDDREEAGLIYDAAVLHYRGGRGYMNFLPTVESVPAPGNYLEP